jgi:hypothetical protein
MATTDLKKNPDGNIYLKMAVGTDGTNYIQVSFYIEKKTRNLHKSYRLLLGGCTSQKLWVK